MKMFNALKGLPVNEAFLSKEHEHILKYKRTLE
jgi:hypothetical protein